MTEPARDAGLGGILGAMLAQGKVAPSGPAPRRWETFLKTGMLGELLLRWIGFGRVRQFRKAEGRKAIVEEISRTIAAIDRLLEKQVNAILHHQKFQALEASWRGLLLLWKQAREWEDYAEQHGLLQSFQSDERPFALRIFSANKREMQINFERAVEFDQSRLFHLIYEEEFGQPGGKPYGLVLVDHTFTNHPDDVALMGSLMEVGAASFCPVVAGASPQLLGLQDFSVLEQPINVASVFQQPEYIKWRALREREDARYFGLTVPRIMMREPYRDDGSRTLPFRFRERTSKPDRSELLWGNAVYAFGSVVLRAYFQSAWMADIRGFDRGYVSGGLVVDLPVYDFLTDRPGTAIQSAVEVRLTEPQERVLADLGFIPLCASVTAEYAVFYSNSSIQKPKAYSEPDASVNARISAMLQYMLCAGRFAHYLKVRARDKIGGLQTAAEIQTHFNDWLSQYVLQNDRADPEMKARFPLRDSTVQVREVAESPGTYKMTFRLQPHYQLDAVTASLRLTTEVGKGN